mmetsp:Transcript_124551/g.387813  ORF Transcript_124551/g.387813 Transcript_124551/m.387813 type:complete len:621 (+) Transcript_124551:57-1919(+)
MVAYQLLRGMSDSLPSVESASPPQAPEAAAPMQVSRASRRSAQLGVKESTRGKSRCCALAERLVIVPEETGWFAAWDIWMVIVLLITTYYEPYAVAVLPEDPQWAIRLNLVLDLTFSLDILLTFFIAYDEPLESAADNSLLVRDLSRIASRYCGAPLSDWGRAGWFWIDIATVLPGWLEDILPPETMGGSEALVLLRLMRLVRLTKLVRLQHLLLKWHQRFGFPFFVVDLGKFVFITTMAIHWIACLWIVVEGRVSSGKVSYRTDQESWLSALIKAKGDSCSPSAAESPVCVYVMAVYWATMTLTTVGYGDITAQNPMEYAVCTACMFVMAYIWAYVVGKMVTLLESLDPQWQHFKQSMDTVQSLMESRCLPKEMQRRVRRYMHEARLTSVQRVQKDQLQVHVSQSLQREVAMCSGTLEKFTTGVFWAQDLQQDALLDLVRALEPESFGPQEIMMLPHTLMFMRRGLSAHRGRIMNRGDIWGQSDILLVTDALIESAFPRTLSYVDILSLSREKLIGVCQAFPHADKRIRRAQIRTAVWRAFIKTARDRTVKPSRASAVVASAATSFVNPGRLTHMCNVSARHKEETTLADLKYKLEELDERQEALHASVKAMLVGTKLS